MQMVVVFAQANYKTAVPTLNYIPLTPLPFTGDCAPEDIAAKKTHCLPTTVPNLGRYLRGVYMLGVALAGLFAVFSIVSGGFTLLFTDSILGHSEGKTKILHALGGLLIVYSSYILMNQINPQLGRDLNLSLALPRISVTKGLFSQLSSLSDASARTEIYKQLMGEVIQNTRDANTRATSEDAVARKIFDDPAIQALVRRREQAADLASQGEQVPDGVGLTAGENQILDQAVAESDKHQKIADNTRSYHLAVSTIDTQVHNSMLPGDTVIAKGSVGSGNPESSASFLKERVGGYIAALEETGGDVATDPRGVETQNTTEAIASLVTKANDAVSVLCNKQYNTTPDTPAITPGYKNPATHLMIPPTESQAVINRNRCVETNSVN